MTDIVLIGGASGTGKTYLARKLAEELGFHHTLGSGFVREICRNFITNDQNPYLHSYSFERLLDLKGYSLLKAQSEPMVNSIISCIERAKREGTRLIIEGVNILPCLYSDIEVDLKVILNNAEEEKHNQMMSGKSHSKRIVNVEDFEMTKNIQRNFIKDGLKYEWKVLESSNAFEEVRNILGKI